MGFLSVFILIGRSSNTSHERGHSPWLHARHTKRHCICAKQKVFFLFNCHLYNLRQCYMPSFNAGTSVLVELEPSFNMPFNCLAQPALDKLNALFHANYVMLVFH